MLIKSTQLHASAFFHLWHHLLTKNAEMPLQTMQVPYLLEKDDDGDIVLMCSNVPEGKLYPEEVSGQILAHMLTHTTTTPCIIGAANLSTSSLKSHPVGEKCQSKKTLIQLPTKHLVPTPLHESAWDHTTAVRLCTQSACPKNTERSHSCPDCGRQAHHR